MSSRNPDLCRFDGCPKLVFSRGWCGMHYNRWRRHGDPAIAGGLPRGSNAIPFDDLIDRSGGPDACWPWTGYVNPQGYGKWGHERRQRQAHQEVWRRAYGEPPPRKSGLVLDHICHNPRTCTGGDACPHRRCCNPSHLAVVPAAVNLSSERNSIATRRPTCARGHPFDEANTYYWRTNRYCRACREVRHAATGRW